MNELTPNIRHRRVAFSLLLLIALLAVGLWGAKTAPSQFQQLTMAAGHTLGSTTHSVLDAQPGLWHVSRTIDGDTIVVALSGRQETVRLLGIDTPETHDPRKPVQCFGQAAADHTRQLLQDKNVRLEPDPTDSDRDKYGRLLRYVYLPDGTLINARLIADGYAFAYTIFPLTKLDDFIALQAAARDHNRGLWASCRVNDSSDIKQTNGPK